MVFKMSKENYLVRIGLHIGGKETEQDDRMLLSRENDYN